MDHLRAADVAELQDFFNTYYPPNNATLIVAGDVDVEATKKLVRKFYGWIPRGGEIRRDVGAAVVRASPGGGVVLELGPADGPAHLRLVLTAAEAMRLSATLQAIANGRGEEILIVDE